MNSQRLEILKNHLKDENIEQMVVSDPLSIYYLTGLFLNPGERMFVLLVDSNSNHKLFINKLFPIDDIKNIEKIVYKDTDKPVEILAENIRDGKIGIDKNWPAHFLLSLMQLKQNEFVNSSVIIDKMRMYKDDEEKEKMRYISKLNDKAIKKLIENFDTSKTELEIKDDLLKIYDELGAEGVSFDPIIGYGPNGANPHGEPGDRSLKEGDSIIIDIGCKKDMYCSDMTRTIFFKHADQKRQEVYNIVREAYKRGFSKVKPGVKFSEIDKACRDYITEKGYGEYFTHRTGHHIGLEDHDYGDVSETNDSICEEGMIFSIEPGIYLEGEFGVRIEDLVLVTKDGCEDLNSYPTDLMIIE